MISRIAIPVNAPGEAGFSVAKPDPLSVTAQITFVAPDGAAAQAGMRTDHSIISIGSTPVTGLTVDEIHQLISQMVSRFGEVTLHITDDPYPVTTTSSETRPIVTQDIGHLNYSDHALPLIRKQAYRAGLVTDGYSSDRDSPTTPISLGGAGLTEHGLMSHGSSPSPQISYKPRHTPLRGVFHPTIDPYRQSSSLGAVARLAIDGGLSAEQLLHIGQIDTGAHTPCGSQTCAPLEVKPDMSSVHEGKRTIVYPSRVCRSPPRNTVSSHTQRFSRPTRQPVPHCWTYQPIHLSRASYTTEGVGRAQSRTHGRGQPCIAVSRGQPNNPAGLYYCTSRRGSFPLQMTRVGGIVLNQTNRTSTPDTSENAASSHVPLTSHVSYQSVSACTSPASGKHTSASSSPSTAMAFFSGPINCVPSPVQTSPMLVSSAPAGCEEIVRLGPGDTVTHASPGEHTYNATSVIRMHDCPQPYVSMAPPMTSLPPTRIQTGGQNSPTVTNGRSDKLGTEHSTILSRFTNPPITAGTGVLRHSSPAYFHFQLTPLQSLQTEIGAHRTGFSPPGPQVARTVRHLRRIRHIFGDSLGYSSSGTSASTGALASSEVEAKYANSLIELRSHGSRSVDSVRPMSCTCKCFPESLPFGPCDCMDNLRHDGLQESPLFTASTSSPVWVCFSRCEADVSHNWTSWERYRLRMSDNVLVMTHFSAHQKCARELNTKCDPLAHLHIPLAEGSICWYSPDEYPGRPATLPDGASFDDSPSSLAIEDAVFGVLKDLQLRTQQFTRCLILLDRHSAVDLFGQWAPPTADRTTRSKATSSKNLASSPTRTTSSIRPQSRSKIVNGRSSSLGLAGPPGAAPMFRAIGTAAASIGMPLAGRSNLLPWLHSHGAHKTIEISNPIPIESPFDSFNGGLRKMKDPTPVVLVQTDSVPTTPDRKAIKKQPRSGQGRFQQALTRMRRAATASGDSSAASSSAGTRRFASTHGCLTHTKSSANTPDTDSPRTAEITEFTSEIEPEMSSTSRLKFQPEPLTLSSPALLLATSVSPTPALQTPCVTYLTTDRSDVAVSGPHSPLNQSGRSQDDLLKAPGTETLASSSESGRQSSSEVLSSTSATNVSERSQQTFVDKPVHGNASSFIPLPLSASGPLMLQKCPRSTLSPFVPFVVELCVTLVERYGLNCVGLYRLSGSKVAHDFISTELRKTLPEIDVHSDKWNDIHAVCGVLKTFLRNLPDSLFPKVMYADFLAACRIPQREKRLLSIQRLLGIMECYPHHPEYRAHRATLRYLATHLARVCAREAVNKMTSYNLALVFAPNLVQPYEDSPELLMSDSKYKILLVEIVIKYHSWIFSPDLGLESGCSIPTDSVEDLSSACTAELELIGGRVPNDSALQIATPTSLDVDDTGHVPGRVEGDVQPLVAELLNAASDLPPPPSDMDLETAEEPGPSSDRPSDIAMPVHRPRFTSIPTSTWSAAALHVLDSGGQAESLKFRPELILTQEVDLSDLPSERRDSDMSVDGGSLAVSASSSRLRPMTTHLGSKLDSLRHLSQGCLDQYATEARELGVRVAESRRQLECTTAQRLHAEQLLQEARSQNVESSEYSDRTAKSSSSLALPVSSEQQRPQCSADVSLVSPSSSSPSKESIDKDASQITQR
ncbi:hypothetical protein EG68_00426 [Paragonimus skrjabini miyazakii]|uniref:Rho GTPase-activating protein 21 n=1 Tax=Paragonimus skrjabini miyazakii TaxID=59628 RepID=A0A8S9Z456_9TREM|nr:hypothetical protein EG68_00426 [Paragonimus skrjabini miyazakii]